MVALMGFLALGVDVGVLFNTKREMQIAADAGATAAALEYLHNGYDKKFRYRGRDRRCKRE
jgi:uncharacterized membrane protein